MEAERIYNLTEQGGSVQRACFMHYNSFSQSASPGPITEEVFDKFSSSEAMLGNDCSKRVLATNKELAVPPKKRKPIHEENLCDSFTDMNLQKSEPNEEDKTIYQKFGKENLCAPTSIKREKELEGTIEFNLQPSVHVKADDSSEWIDLKCFESIPVDESSSATFFAGGPIQSSAFSIMPHDMKVNQYVAVAAGSVIHKNHSYNNTKNVSGIIQFWNVGSLHERKTLNKSPAMELALCHDNGIITQMKWCPSDCYDKRPSTLHLPRLGVLAASSSNSYVYIYNVPQPDFMPKLKSTFPIYFTVPFMKLIPLFDGPSHATSKAVATCLEWDRSGKRIVAGYANGAVCVWMINVSSPASCRYRLSVEKTEKSNIIHPYLFFQASGASITSLSFAPFNNNRWLVVSSIDKVLRFFDLHDTSAPFHIVKQGLENSCIWSEAFCGVYSSPALNSMGLISLSAKDCCAEGNDKGAQKGLFDSSANVAVSEKRNCHAIADMAGAVTVNFLKKIDKPLETSYLTFIVFETEIVALDMKKKASKCNKSISMNIPNLASDVESSSSSSSGYSSPKHGKTILIEMTPNACRDINNNGKKPLNSGEEANDYMIKCFESSECLMRDLLMEKISNQSESSSDIFQLNTRDNSAHSDSKGAKYLSDQALVTSFAASNKTIMYPIKPCFSDTSHPNPLMSDSPFQNRDAKGSFVFEKDIKLSSAKSFDNPLCDILESNYLNQPKFLPDTLSSATKNKSIICDKDDQQVSERTLIQSSAASDSSDSTILYMPESYYLEMEKPGATFQSLFKSEKENTFLDEKELVILGAKTENLSTENCSFAREKHEHFLTKESLKNCSENGTDSATGSCNLGDKGKNFFQEDFCISDFQLLHSKYVREMFEEKHSELNELSTTRETAGQGSSDLAAEAPTHFLAQGIEPDPEINKNPQELSYKNLITSFGVIFKNNLKECTNLLNRQENGIYIKYNPLSVINTIAWDPNEGCHSWLFVGGNSGIGRLVFVPEIDKKPRPMPKKRQLPKRF